MIEHMTTTDIRVALLLNNAGLFDIDNSTQQEMLTELEIHNGIIRRTDTKRK